MLRQFRAYLIGCVAFFLAVFASYYVVVTVYSHIHIVNGIMLVHAHPFKTHHDHTAGQTVVLHFLSVFHSLEAEPFEGITVYRPFLEVLHGNTGTVSFEEPEPSYVCLRAPPVSLFI